MDNERIALKKSLREMGPGQKLSYFFSYYTIHFVLVLIALAVLAGSIIRYVTKKETVLYVALTNAAIGSSLETDMTEAFLAYADLPAKKNDVQLYKELYISEDPAAENHEYAYASGLKVMAAINAEKMDLVLMNRESYDYFSGKGYLSDISLLAEENGLRTELAPYLSENEVILADNSLEVALGEAEKTDIRTETVTNAVNVSSFPVFRKAGFDGDLYLGVIANSPRPETACLYLRYLLS